MWAFCLLHPPAPATAPDLPKASPQPRHTQMSSSGSCSAPGEAVRKKRAGQAERGLRYLEPTRARAASWVHRKGSASIPGPSEDDGIVGAVTRHTGRKASSFCRNRLFFLNLCCGCTRALRGAQRWEGQKESVLWPTGEKANNPHQKRAREDRGTEKLCKDTFHVQFM